MESLFFAYLFINPPDSYNTFSKIRVFLKNKFYSRKKSSKS